MLGAAPLPKWRFFQGETAATMVVISTANPHSRIIVRQEVSGAVAASEVGIPAATPRGTEPDGANS
jgi:hypothetical protein